MRKAKPSFVIFSLDLEFGGKLGILDAHTVGGQFLLREADSNPAVRHLSVLEECLKRCCRPLRGPYCFQTSGRGAQDRASDDQMGS